MYFFTMTMQYWNTMQIINVSSKGDDTMFNEQAHDKNMFNENNTNLSKHVNGKVDGNAKRHIFYCHNDYTV